MKILRLEVPPMATKTNELTKLLDIFPEDAIVNSSKNGITVTNADRSGEAMLLNDHIDSSPKNKLPDAA
jgi:hypothetical protein